MVIEEKYMARCIELARLAIGYTAPNPMVGAVVVYDGRIIGEGYHRRCGEAHAEVNAIASVEDEALLRQSTLYVNLEPCSHYGKTPPCAELIIRKQIPRVVVGCLDPFPEVSGRGVRMLREAGVEVVTGIMENEARQLNAAFMTFHTKHRPYVCLKWAQSADGFIDCIRETMDQSPIHFSSPETLRYVHRLRSEYAAIMVGRRTACLDNPSLTVRHWVGHQPVRLVVDHRLQVPPVAHLLDGTVPTLIFTSHEATDRPNVSYLRLDDERPFLTQLMDTLYQHQINSLLVEGGTHLLSSFLDANMWDEAHVEITPVCLQEGVAAPTIRGVVQCTKCMGNHVLQTWRPFVGDL